MPVEYDMQHMPRKTLADTFAAVDLGSNSFHLLVSRRDHGELRVLDRIKEMVRLGGGLDEDGNIDEDTVNRAYSCLARFGQRLRGIPADNIRAVGTQTFRRMKNANAFLMIAETALGAGIDIIGGYLTEINVTSPTGIQEIDRFDGISIEKYIWDAIEARVEARPGGRPVE